MMAMTPNFSGFLRERIYTIFDKEQSLKLLPELCLNLLSQQKNTWPDCRQGYASLESIKVREIACNGFSVRIQHNPGRIKSTLADVREKKINERPCFLCLSNLPEEQKGVFYKNTYLILCNPAPVSPSHFTICDKNHNPQLISEHINAFLRFMVDFGEGWTMLYNGPKCGASAPDHLHFQAIPSGQMPVEKEVKEMERFVEIRHIDSVLFSRISNIGREALMLEGDNIMALASAFKGILSAMKRAFFADHCGHMLENLSGEPMINIIGLHNEGNLRLVVFPRAKHRPDVFFKEGNARVLISPAVVEMGGIIVTPAEKDFECLDASAVEDIYREVSLDSKTVNKVIDYIAPGFNNL